MCKKIQNIFFFFFLLGTMKDLRLVAVIIYCMIMTLIYIIKPHFLFREGELREFGLERMEDTAIPVWMVAMISAVVAYIGASQWTRVKITIEE